MQEKLYPLNTTFGISCPKEITTVGFEVNPSDPGFDYIPEVEPHFQHRPDFLRDLLGWWQCTLDKHLDQDGFLCYGPQGSGKTSGITQTAAMLNIPCIEVTGHERLEVEELLGGNTIIGGDMMYVDGPLTTAARNGWWFVLNEGDALDPSQQIALNEIVRGRPFTLPTGEVVKPSKHFRFLATANTNFGGDLSGMFQGTKRQNVAFSDRFFITELDYPTPEMEEAVIEARLPSVSETGRKKMVEFANLVRKLFKGESAEGHEGGCIEVTMSTRTLLRWAHYTTFFQATDVPVEYALDRAFALKAEPQTREVLHELLQRVFAGGN